METVVKNKLYEGMFLVDSALASADWDGILAVIRRILEKAKTEPAAGRVDGLPDEHYAKIWLEMYEKQEALDNVSVMAVRIGDLAIVGLPGEIFCEFGMEIKKRSPAKHTIVIEWVLNVLGVLRDC